MRIGTNHGSLSDRIMSRYGDTPLGMVESALEFLRICEDLNYHEIVLSMKASNTQVMVQAYRLLVQKLDEEGFKPYPLHLGVTEAGDGEDGRIKSAVGIGALLEDGLGDTIRVSLTEEPEHEAPVAQILVDRYIARPAHLPIKPVDIIPVNPYVYSRRKSREIKNIGGENVPRVIADLSLFNDLEVKDLKNIGHHYLPELDKWKMTDLGADYVFTGNHPISFMLPNGLKEIQDFGVWEEAEDKVNKYPLLYKEQLPNLLNGHAHPELNFLRLKLNELDNEVMDVLKNNFTIVILLDTDNEHAMADQRRFFFELINRHIDAPVIILRKYSNISSEQLQIYAATDIGGLLIDGLGDGATLSTGLIFP